MKHIAIITLFIIQFSIFSLSASVPLRWNVETSRATPAQFEAYQGETLDLEAALQSYGKPLEASGIAALYWQTNGMGSTYWEASAAVNSNRLSAVFTPEMDVGAKVYNCFIGVPGTIYHAAFQLRLRPSPGATPNVLPLPTPVIDFAKVRVLNPPWEGGGGGGVNTNAVIDIIHKTVSGAARTLPKYLHERSFDDSYPEEADEYYRSRGNGKTDGGCSSVRDGGFLYRNFDYPFDDRAEFVVKMSAGPNRFASVGVAQVGTNLTEQFVVSGKPSRCYKWLPGATVDGINENGVACNINVVDGDPQTSGWHTTGDLNPLAAIRWILDNATNAEHAARYIAANIRFPSGWTQNFHYMIADERETWIVEDGVANDYGTAKAVMTNFIVDPPSEGDGLERYGLLFSGTNITNAWYTNAYRRETNPPWVSDLKDVLAYTNDIYNAWATHPKEYFRNSSLIPYTSSLTWWQTVHTSIYDLTKRILRICVQETDDWYTFQVPSSGAKIDAYTKAETDEKLAGKRGLDDLSFDSMKLAQFLLPITDMFGAVVSDYSLAVYGNSIGLYIDGLVRAFFNLDGTYQGIDSGEYLYNVKSLADYAAAGMTNMVVLGDSIQLGKDIDLKVAEAAANKLTKPDESLEPSNGHFLIGDGNGGTYVDPIATFDRFDTMGISINVLESTKATKQIDATAGNLASFDGNGDLADSGKSPSDFRETTDNTCHRDQLGNVWTCVPPLPPGYVIARLNDEAWEPELNGNPMGASIQDPDNTETNLSWAANEWQGGYAFTATRRAVTREGEVFLSEGAISADNPTFSNEVATVARKVLPTVIRAYDRVRRCWWVLEMVNGVPNWTVED